MNIRLHNKYEVICGDKKYVAYNTMLKSVFDKIKALEPYNSYFAFGTGTGAVDFENSSLGSYVATYQNTTEQIQADCFKGDMFVIKSKLFGENEGNGLQFSELGITDSMASNPTIYNHVVLTNDNGEVVTVTKLAGQEMVIRLTIYLDASNDGNARLVAGDNPLVKQLLGEDVLTNKTLTFAKGTNNQPNVTIYRDLPKDTTTYESENITYYLADSVGVGIKYNVNYGEGELREMVVLADNVPVIRYNCLAEREAISKTETLTKNTNNCVILSDDVKEVISCTSEDGLTNISFKVDNYSHSFGDYITAPFDMPFNNETTRFVSKEGSLIAFILNGNVYIYKNHDYIIEKIDATAISGAGVTQVLMVLDYVFTKTSQSPYLNCYKIVNGACQFMEINTSLIADTTFNFNLSNMDVTQSKDGKIRIAGINSSQKGVCLIASEQDGILKAEKLVTGANSPIEAIACLYQNNFCDSLVFFLTSCYNNIPNMPRVEMVTADGELDNNQIHAAAWNLINNSSKVFGTDRVICSKKLSVTESSIFNTYFYPENLRYNIANDGEIDLYISPDFNTIIKKYSSTSYKIFSIVGYSTPVEFTDSFFGTLNQAEFVDFAFLKDSLLIFTSNADRPIIAINLNRTGAMLEGLTSNDPESVVVNYNKFNPLGAGAKEHVEATLTLTIGGFNS